MTNIKTKTVKLLFVFVFAFSMLFPAGVLEAGPPVACSGPIIAFGRQEYCGYFDNQGFDVAPEFNDVRPGGVPASVDTAAEFIAMIHADLVSADPQTLTGARFLVLTMIGEPAGSPRTVTPAQLAEWEARIMSYANITDVPGNSTGTHGSIAWNEMRALQCNEINTYWQDEADDVAAFIMDPIDHPWCTTALPEEHIIFKDTSNNPVYRIRRACMNPVGAALSDLPEPNLVDPPSFQKTYTVNGPVLRWRLVWINQSDVSGVLAQVDDDIPAGTTYVEGSLSCEARGTSTTATCAYDSAANKVTWSGTVGADAGHADEASAANEIIMTFDTSLVAGTSDVANQATCSYDKDNDGIIEPSEEGDCTSNAVLASGLSTGGSLADTGSPSAIPLFAGGGLAGVSVLVAVRRSQRSRPYILRRHS